MPENRTRTGQFCPGSSGNPGGRPKRTDNEKAVLEAVQGLAPQAVALVASLIADKLAPIAMRLKAAEMILDRTIGKPLAGADFLKKQESDEFAQALGL